MKAEQMSQILEEAATKIGIKVRYEPLPPGGTLGGGGLCRVKGEWQLIIDKKAGAADRAAILIDTLAGFDTSAVELPTKIKNALAARRPQPSAPTTAEAEPPESQGEAPADAG